MAATTPIHLLPQVQYIAGRKVILGDSTYYTGDPIPAEVVLASGHVEALIRGRYTVPVVDDAADIPRLYWREIRTRDHALAKLKMEHKHPKHAAKAAEAKPAAKRESAKTAKKAASKPDTE